MDFKEYIVQRIEEMPLVTLATEEKDGAVCIDFTKVDEKMYNGVLIENAANAAKILTEEYMTAVTPDAEKDQLLWFTYEGMTEKALKKKMNMMEACVSSIYERWLNYERRSEACRKRSGR